MLTTQSPKRSTVSFFPVPCSPQDLPVFKTLNQAQSEAVLVRSDVGRIAFTVDSRVQILPIHYVYRNGWIYGRTAAAAFLPANASVAFQVDEMYAGKEWRSVVVEGRLDLVQSESPEKTQSAYRSALMQLRRIVRPEPTATPPVLLHDQLFAIRASEITGRASLPGEGRCFAS